MRQAVYDLARYKLREQFNHADEREIRRTQRRTELSPTVGGTGAPNWCYLRFAHRHEWHHEDFAAREVGNYASSSDVMDHRIACELAA